MKDAIGQEINVGDKVCHCGGNYASAKIHEVLKVTDKRITVAKEYEWEKRNPSLEPRTLVVVTENLKVMDGEGVIMPKNKYNQLVHDSLFLGCLNSAGVDNWDGYHYAYVEFNELCPEAE